MFANDVEVAILAVDESGEDSATARRTPRELKLRPETHARGR